MGRLFLILVKRFGYESARKMAPKYGISERVINKTIKDAAMAQPRQFRQRNMYNSPDEDIAMIGRMFPGRPTQTFAQRKAGRRLQEPLYYKRQAEKLNRLTRRNESYEDRLARLIDEFYDKGV